MLKKEEILSSIESLLKENFNRLREWDIYGGPEF